MSGPAGGGRYRALLESAVASSGIDRWEGDGYRFSFRNGEYCWNGRKLKITPREAFYLYERLVQKIPPSSTVSVQALYSLRKKYGSGFLREMFPYREVKKRGGRKTDFAYEIEGKYLREDGRPRFNY
jgi:hypothetical protein